MRKRETSGQQTCGSNHTDRALTGGAGQRYPIGQGKAAEGKTSVGEALPDAEDVRRGSVERGAQKDEPTAVVMMDADA